MDIFILKLVLAPVIIGSASLAGRKWGPAVSGWIIGLPLTSGPVVFFLALSHDTVFAANAALGVISGGISLVAYVLTYIWLARHGWQVAIIGSLLVFLVSTALLQNFTFPLIPIFVVVCTVLFLSLRLMPNDAVSGREVPPGAWDIPARIIIGTSFILLLTGIAPFIGSHLTGLLSTVPLYISILTVFAHRHQGAAAAAHVLRGLLYGLFAFASFFLALNLLLERAGIAVAFLSATAVALATQGISLWALRQTQK
ncbi:MAG TPA: hypothetical protein VFR47_27005 [Anaerolineales bacterium]|nr:hypothetical protein [Anaerolineales bacterium]